MERRNRFLQGVGALLHGNWRSKTCFLYLDVLLDVRAKNAGICRVFFTLCTVVARAFPQKM